MNNPLCRQPRCTQIVREHALLDMSIMRHQTELSPAHIAELLLASQACNPSSLSAAEDVGSAVRTDLTLSFRVVCTISGRFLRPNI